MVGIEVLRYRAQRPPACRHDSLDLTGRLVRCTKVSKHVKHFSCFPTLFVPTGSSDLAFLTLVVRSNGCGVSGGKGRIGESMDIRAMMGVLWIDRWDCILPA